MGSRRPGAPLVLHITIRDINQQMLPDTATMGFCSTQSCGQPGPGRAEGQTLVLNDALGDVRLGQGERGCDGARRWKPEGCSQRLASPP
jgi:hypothetical protein